MDGATNGELTLPVRVLVCGETLRGDDGAAPAAIRLLPPEARAAADITEVGQLSVEALLDIPLSAAVIVADAVRGVAPGRVVVLPLSELARAGGPHFLPTSSHAMPPDQVVALAAELRGAAPRGVFVGIGGAEFGFGEGLSRAVADALPAYASTLAEEILRLAGGAPDGAGESGAPNESPAT